MSDDEQKNRWLEAMKDEMNSLHEKSTFELVTRIFHEKYISLKATTV
jgi:hypothetical protein